ncbi:MAG: hypothetical protein ACE5Q3_15405 [Alphaproteobacteria bacterium]
MKSPTTLIIAAYAALAAVIATTASGLQEGPAVPSSADAAPGPSVMAAASEATLEPFPDTVVTPFGLTVGEIVDQLKGLGVPDDEIRVILDQVYESLAESDQCWKHENGRGTWQWTCG